MKKITFIIIIAGLGLYFSQSFLHSNQQVNHNDEEHSHKLTDSSDKENKSSKPSQKNTPIASHDSHAHGSNDDGYEVEVVQVPSDSAGQSLMELGEIVENFAIKDTDVEALTNSLTKSGLEVVSTKDSNPYTGSMTVIRTNNVLPGTRYFHAQIFTDEDGKPFVQHMSFEYRPSEKAFAEAVAAAKSAFGLTRVADVRKDGFYSWNTDDGYIIWVKKMGKEDFVDDPFNAYSDADVGTIKVAKEIEIH